MTIEFTEEQQRAVRRGEPVRLPVPDFGEEIVVLRASVYEEIRELLEEEQERKTIAGVALRNAAARMDEAP